MYWRGPFEKLTTAVAALLTYNVPIDIVAGTLWIAAVVAMVRIEALRRARVDWLHIATFTFFILYLAMPARFGTTFAADTRLLIPTLICCIALIARLPVRQVVVGGALALAATLVRVGTIQVSWTKLGQVQSQHLSFIRQLPLGARILGIIFPDVSRFNSDAHVIAWAVPERQAMVSSLFGIAGQQPLTVRVK